MALDPKHLQPGKDQMEEFYSRFAVGMLIQYDYRDHDGELFSTVAPTLAEAVRRRDTWLKDKSFEPGHPLDPVIQNHATLPEEG